MDVTQILSRLSKVRSTGPRRWVACCPAHEDRSPSLSVLERNDGSILLHCFAGCEFKAVVEALALEPSDLFRRENEYRSPPRATLSAWDVLTGLKSEAGIIALLASDIADHKPISSHDADRGMLAFGRIVAAARFINERR